MQTTNTFGFNVVEGTDIVNPLTQLNPNFTSLDTLLARFANRTVNKAACTKSGTVFAIVRETYLMSYVSSMDFMMFNAPADYNEGDTFTVNGVAVTATYPDGESLTEGAFVTGKPVYVLKNGNDIVVYGSEKYVPTASEVTTTAGDSVQDYIDNTKFKNLETWTPNIGENWETFLARIRDNSTKTIPANFIRCTVDGVSGLIFRQSRRTSATSWQYETDYFTGNSLVKYVMSVGSDTAVLRKYDILNGTVQNLSSADAQTINIYGLDV